MKREPLDKTSTGMMYVVIAAVMWAFSGTLGQILSQDMKIDPLWIVTVRINISGIILMAISLIRNGKDVFRIFYNRKHILQIILFALFGNAVMQLSYFFCEFRVKCSYCHDTAVPFPSRHYCCWCYY